MSSAPVHELCVGYVKLAARADAHEAALTTMSEHLLSRIDDVLDEVKAVRAAQEAEVSDRAAARLARYALVREIATLTLRPVIVIPIAVVLLALIAAATGLSVSYGGAVISALDAPIEVADDAH